MNSEDPHDVVRLAAAATPFQAHIWQQALEQVGIRCQVLGDYLDGLQRQTFDYFVHEVNPVNGLVADKTQESAPASIAAVERAFITRAEAAERTLATLRFFRNSTQGTESEATGYKGFYYHFLDMKTGRR